MENLSSDLLKKIPFFSTLSEASHQEIIKNVGLKVYQENLILFREGDFGDALYIIKSGMVKISRGGKEVSTLIKNDFFGEMALISDEPRNATAMTIQECELFISKKEDFMKLVESNPEIANLISETFISRLKKNKKSL